MTKKIIAAITAAALLLTATPTLAGGYGHGGRGYGYYGSSYYSHGYGDRYKYRPYYRHGYGYRRGGYDRHRGHGQGYAVGGVLAGGILLGYLLSRPVQPVAVIARPQPSNCQINGGTGTWNGRAARFNRTLCYDQSGQAYIVPGSTRFIGYLE